jgi:hypothetical protein
VVDFKIDSGAFKLVTAESGEKTIEVCLEEAVGATWNLTDPICPVPDKDLVFGAIETTYEMVPVTGSTLFERVVAAFGKSKKAELVAGTKIISVNTVGSYCKSTSAPLTWDAPLVIYTGISISVRTSAVAVSCVGSKYNCAVLIVG